jgi:hypothetical protein
MAAMSAGDGRTVDRPQVGSVEKNKLEEEMVRRRSVEGWLVVIDALLFLSQIPTERFAPRLAI